MKKFYIALFFSLISIPQIGYARFMEGSTSFLSGIVVLGLIGMFIAKTFKGLIENP